ncbi:ERI1 exoribonuclease 2 [Archocentrus centrarchus]|uniref:ERI1 exoribonuclease 2 n=1 Tax=Archocentrus centrarchus TaxID=63155 RepID=UPI0011E9E078|nr:ERI1 exoribonuclease 2 [Archocentrus centrarchus]
MSTKKLAKELGLLRQRSKSSVSKKSVVSNQVFSYLIVIDFESTCWREKNNYSQEIIEFPAVLLSTSTGEVESEFHAYVQPQEHPILSEFCTELTGITQTQVEAGIPLQICLSRFSRWLQNLQFEMGMVFAKKDQRCSAPSQKLCTFLTWSDWDLGVCLQYECKRKQLHKPDVLNSWIDLRSTYRLFYNRKPKGLNGALQDLGIQFSGREHSGLDDARNTAQLAARMMRDGCIMKITRSLERTPVMVKPVFENITGPADKKKEKPNSIKKESTLTTSKPSSFKIPLKVCQKLPRPEEIARNTNAKEKPSSIHESAQICQSLISPKTLLNGAAAQLLGHGRRSVTAEAAPSLSSSVMTNCVSPQNNNNSLVLCPTTVSCFSILPPPNWASRTEAMLGCTEKEEGAELVAETEERCGSYDDVVLEGDEAINEADNGCDTGYIPDFNSGCCEREQHHSAGNQLTFSEMRESGGKGSKVQKITTDSSVTSQVKKSHVYVSNHTTEMMSSESDAYFAVPKTVNFGKSNQCKTGLRTSLQLQETSYGHNKSCSIRPKPFVPEKIFTPNTSFVRSKSVNAQISNHKETLRSSFTIYTETTKQATAPSHPSSRGSLHASKGVLSSLSTNTLSCADRSTISMRGAQKITSPLCACGRRAKRQVVSNGGPNHGRGFYCCPVRRSGSRGRMEKGCEFFKWESAVMKSSSAAAPAVGSSVSLCQINSTLSHHPPHRSLLRKSY